MAVLSIKARVSCDDCGKSFDVDIDPAATCSSAFEAVEEAMRGGEGSYYDRVMRCDPCTTIHTRAWIAANPNKLSGITRTADGWDVETYSGAKAFVPEGDPAGEPQFDTEASAYLTAVAR